MNDDETGDAEAVVYPDLSTRFELHEPERVIYHIGHHKTGTTAVQNMLRKMYGPAKAKPGGILYPDVGHPRDRGGVVSNHNSLHYMFSNPQHPWLRETPIEASRRMTQLVQTLRPQTLVLSAEDAFFAGQRPRTSSELNAIDAIVPFEKEFVAFLRRPDYYAMSWHKQLLWFGAKVGPLHSEQRFEWLKKSCVMNYPKALKPYLERTGTVSVHRYAPGTDSIELFFTSVLGVKKPKTKLASNPSIPDVFAELGRRRTATTALTPKQIRALIGFGQQEKVDLIGPENRLRMRTEFDASNEWLRETFGDDAAFDDLDGMLEVPSSWLTVDEATEKYRDVFFELIEIDDPGKAQAS